jgi:hypothetical protein
MNSPLHCHSLEAPAANTLREPRHLSMLRRLKRAADRHGERKAAATKPEDDPFSAEFKIGLDDPD